MEMLNAALSYAAKGWHVFPTHSVRDGICTCGKSECNAPGKHPIFKGGFKEATTDINQIEFWWHNMPWANIGIATGAVSGVTVLDVDMSATKDGLQTLKTLESRFQAMPKTYVVRTGSGGYHYYLAAPSTTLRNSAGRLGEGLDIRGDGGYVIAPPSVHISGNLYAVEHAHA